MSQLEFLWLLLVDDGVDSANGEAGDGECSDG